MQVAHSIMTSDK